MTPCSCPAAWPLLLALLAAAPVGRAARVRGAGAGAVHRGERTPRVEIRRPLTDKRTYLHTTFDSGLRVLVVSDPEAEKASFAVAVEAGSLEDPPAFQGLAHFCEHMLFLGSQKYPDTEAFSTTLALYGGKHNAYTAAEETVYFNEINNDGVEKGMDIFAQFFISPTFKEQMVDKEIHAVDSEHKKNQPDTQRRLWHLLRSRANPENPMHQFATGDLETLKTEPERHGQSLVGALRDFHSRNYCPSRLHLVIVSNTSTSAQLDLAHRHFDALASNVNGSCPARPTYLDKPPYSRELGNLGRQFTVATSGAPQLWVMIPLPPLRGKYKQLAEAYVWNALGHYGPGSLKALLKREDLSHSYSFYAESSVAGSVMFVTFALTAKGAKEPYSLLEYFFAYVAGMRKAGVDDGLLDSLRRLRQLEFDYQEKKPSEFDFVSSLAGSMPKYSPQDILTGGFIIDQPDRELIDQVLAALVPSNMNIALVSPDFNSTAAGQREPYYDFRYDEVPIEPSRLARLEAASAADHGLGPPPDLAYVPDRLDLIAEGAGEGGPEKLLDQGRVQLFWLGLGEVRLPKAVVSLKVGFPPAVTARADGAVLAAVHTRLVQLVLEESSDALQTCGLTYSISAGSDGLTVYFSGFDQHISELIALVLPRVRRVDHAEQHFEVVRRQLLIDLGDVTKSQPYQHALEAFEVVTVRGRHSRAELVAAAASEETVSASAYDKFLEDVFANAKLSLLVAGNIGRGRSEQIAEAVEHALGVTRSQPQAVYDGHVQVIKPKEELEIRVANPIANDPNSATLVSYQLGVPTIADRVHLSMIGEVMDRPVFEALRTERQLGYVVFGYVSMHGPVVEVRVLVQGFRETPDVVEDLIEGTVQNLTARIAGMSDEEFATRKNSLRVGLTQKAATMSQFSNRYWSQISDGDLCFRSRALQLAYLDSAEFSTPAPLLQAWKRAIAPAASRKRIAVKLFGAPAPGAPAPTLERSSTAGLKVVTLLNSSAIAAQMSDESYWPHQSFCQLAS